MIAVNPPPLRTFDIKELWLLPRVVVVISKCASLLPYHALKAIGNSGPISAIIRSLDDLLSMRPTQFHGWS